MKIANFPQWGAADLTSDIRITRRRSKWWDMSPGLQFGLLGCKSPQALVDPIDFLLDTREIMAALTFRRDRSPFHRFRQHAVSGIAGFNPPSERIIDFRQLGWPEPH